MCLKNAGGAGRRNGCTERFYHYGLFKWRILPVYPAAEGNQHFVWGPFTNIPPTGGQSGRRKGCDSVFYNSVMRVVRRGWAVTSKAEVEIAPAAHWRRKKWVIELKRRWDSSRKAQKCVPWWAHMYTVYPNALFNLRDEAKEVRYRSEVHLILN